MWTFSLHPHPTALFLLDGLFVERPPTDRPRPVAVAVSRPPATRNRRRGGRNGLRGRSLARPREEEAEENSTRGEETSKVPFGAHHFTAGKRLLGDKESIRIFVFLAELLTEP